VNGWNGINVIPSRILCWVPQTIACLRIAKSPLGLPFDFLGIVYFPLDDSGGVEPCLG
jgi:hypothetical protein